MTPGGSPARWPPQSEAGPRTLTRCSSLCSSLNRSGSQSDGGSCPHPASDRTPGMPTSGTGCAVVAGLPRCLLSRTRTSSWRRSFRAGSVRASEGFRASRSTAEVSPWCLMMVGNNSCLTRPFVSWLPVEFRNCRVRNSVFARHLVPFLPGPELRFCRRRGRRPVIFESPFSNSKGGRDGGW